MSTSTSLFDLPLKKKPLPYPMPSQALLGHVNRGSHTTNHGFTLIELMIGITLGIVVLGAVLAIFIPSFKSWQITTANSYLQDTEQIAQDVFDRAIRPSSVITCGDVRNSIDPDLLSNTVENWAFQLDDTFSVIGANSNSNTISSTFGSIDLYTVTNANKSVGDILITLAPDSREYRIESHDHTSSTKAINFQSSVDIKAGQLFLVHDCEQAVIVRAKSNSTSTLSYDVDGDFIQTTPFAPNTVVSGYEPTAYYLHENNGIPSLYTRKIQLSGANVTHRTDPLLIGVENMRVFYGISHTKMDAINLANDVEFCCTTKQLNQLNAGSAGITSDDYVSIKVVLMMQTPQDVSANTQPSLLFPGLDGKNYDCFDDSINYNNSSRACPEIQNSTKLHRVVSYVYDLPARL